MGRKETAIDDSRIEQYKYGKTMKKCEELLDKVKLSPSHRIAELSFPNLFFHNFINRIILNNKCKYPPLCFLKK